MDITTRDRAVVKREWNAKAYFAHQMFVSFVFYH